MNLALEQARTTSGNGAEIARATMHQHSGVSIEPSWLGLLPSIRASSAGVVFFIAGYAHFFPYPWHVGTSPAIIDLAASPRPAETHSRLRYDITHSDILAMPIADQAREALAALAVNKSQLAEVVGISRPTLYDWLDGKEPNIANATRMTALLRLLARVGVTSSTPLNARFVRQPIDENGTSILQELAAEPWDEKRVEALLRKARLLEEKSKSRRRSREDRLRSLGYEEPSEEERKKLLNQSLAMRDWPNQ